MDNTTIYSKELLMSAATILISAGSVAVSENMIDGLVLIFAGVLVFVARGFYKKYVDKKNC